MGTLTAVTGIAFNNLTQIFGISFRGKIGRLGVGLIKKTEEGRYKAKERQL